MIANIFAKKSPARSIRKTVIGLDVDEKSVKLIELRKTPTGYSLVNYAIEEVPPQAASADKLQAISETIRKTMTKYSVEPGEVYTAISGPGVSIRRITVPDMPDEELFGAVRWEAKNLIPFPLEAVTLDYYVIGKVNEKGTQKLDIIVVAAQDEVINQQIKAIEGAGLKVSGVTVNPFALWDVLKRGVEPKENDVIALLDIGADAASINLFKNNILQFTREISVAGESITKAMTGVLISDQWQLSLTYEQAEKIKTDWGIPPENSQEKTSEGIPLTQILEVMKPTLRRMLNEILRSFDYYKEQFREEKINRVFLAGGSSRLKNLEEYLSTGLGTKVEIVNPISGIGVDIKDKQAQERLASLAPRLTLALGLALGETESLNLLHIKKPEKKGVEIEKIFAAVPVPNKTWVAAAILIVVMAFGYNFYLGHKLSYFREQLREKQNILNDLRLLAERRSIIEKIQAEESHLRETLMLFNQTIPQGVTLSHLSYNNFGRAIDVSGIALNPKLVGKFLTQVEESPDFSGARLIESKSLGEGKGMSLSISLHVD